ncbi:hypothetical protein FFI89_014465 [Bradyrhizobium sp. KBS0727]|uniref:hypothetical protein n=1 Tax=unclassified Bradyrhizobium TaxID=2631580 RepID=UPI00110E7980|nr:MULTISPECIES: hypothetical protein [unclassified Bradyrhizobium]QDW38244.1 hypothetical protein FFI71_014460 [Bradyrhizobium sp. KBS0725]QDW44847.1 hypothetical protein FFI89_014465 [Bradyrhizobium sp. KBS0727]
MAYQPNLNDPYRAGLSDDEFRRQARLNSLDNELPPDLELTDGRASGGKVAAFAIAIAVVLGAVFYGLNNTSVNNAGTSETTKTAQTKPAPSTAPPGMRDVTPKANSESGMTTGAAPSRPSTPVPANPDMNKTASPPADSTPSAK